MKTQFEYDPKTGNTEVDKEDNRITNEQEQQEIVNGDMADSNGNTNGNGNTNTGQSEEQ